MDALPGVTIAQQRRSVFLVGMMGVGKSTAGRLLAGALGYEFIDADTELERRAGVRIATMFELEGEVAFRDRESQLIDELTLRQGIVLATGGGAVLREQNRACLHQRGIAVLLEASPEEILRRTRHDHSRPLLNVPNRLEKIQTLYALRQPLYEEVAHIRLRSPARNPRRMLDALLETPEIGALLPKDNLPAGHA
jgi:shikimate kinase